MIESAQNRSAKSTTQTCVTPRDFGQALSQAFPADAESRNHPHVPTERADLFQSFSNESAEVEVLTFLNALIGLFKPENILETGTGAGYATIAMAAGLERNGFGQIHSIDTDPHALSRARSMAAAVGQELSARILFHCEDSRQFIENYCGEPFDFLFFDSLIGFRHLEAWALLERGLINPGAVAIFHDASRARKQTMDDNSEMIAAIDALSSGRQWLEWPYSRGLRLIRFGGE